MFNWKFLADCITWLRGGLALLFIWLGMNNGPSSLPLASAILILCWTGDFVDGRVAHRSRTSRQTWIGAHDLEVDIFVSLCLGLYLTLAGFVGPQLALLYALGWVLVFGLAGRNHALLMLVQAPIYAWFAWIALTTAPPAGLCLVGWLSLATLINWSRFAHHIVPGFLHDVGQAMHRPHHP